MPKSDFEYAPLEMVMEHPTLYKAVPSLKSLTLGPTDKPYSFFNKHEKFIGISPEHRALESYNDNAGNLIQNYLFNPDVVGHEVNHAIQDVHGLPQGGNENTQKYLNQIFEQKKQSYSPNFERINAAQPELNNFYKIDRIHDFNRVLNKKSYVPSDLYRRGDWYKYSDDIRSELGPMPKKPGEERNNYIRRAHEILFNKYKEEAGITKDDIEYALSKSPTHAKYNINKIWKQLEPDYQAQREFGELRNANERMNNLNPFQVYDRLTGEATSRLVQNRWNMTPAERAANYPRPTLMDTKTEISPYDLIDVYYNK
jgi:hypothetical protein